MCRSRIIFCLFLLACAVSTQAAVPAPQSVTPAQLKQEIARHKGRVVLVNFWATWCDTCREEFPGLVRTAHMYRAQGLVTLTVTADTPSAVGTKAVPFLKAQGADWPQFAQTGTDITAWAQGFDPQWTPAAYPRTYLYDRHGRLVKTLTAPQTAAQFAAAVRPLLTPPLTRHAAP